MNKHNNQLCMETAQFGYDRNGFITRCSHKYSRLGYYLSIDAFTAVIGAVVVEKWRSEVGTTLTVEMKT